jgi:NAD(P)-dependent dehydrogenase (short-subunit alcohol dehydrogenase family)
VGARAVLVTGTSSGLGEACALRLDRAGWRVFAGVRRVEDGDRLRKRASPGLTPLLLDVTDSDAIASAAVAVGDRLEGLVNNAGIAVAAPVELVSLDELRRQLEVNLVGQVAVTQALLPALRRARGRVVNVGSIGGRSALPFLGPYAASKFALEAITDSLRLELRPFGIEVSIIEPGSIATRIWEKGGAAADDLARHLPPSATELYVERADALRQVATAAARRGETPDEVAKAVEHALTAPRPKTRYLVGKHARQRALLERMPDRVRDRVLARRLFGGR